MISVGSWVCVRDIEGDEFEWILLAEFELEFIKCVSACYYGNVKVQNDWKGYKLLI